MKGKHLRGKVRIQDIVAKTSGVNLEHTTRVMVTLSLVAFSLGEDALAIALNDLLKDSARVDGEPATIRSHPGDQDREYCEDMYDLLFEKWGKAALRNMRNLDDDPYHPEVQNG